MPKERRPPSEAQTEEGKKGLEQAEQLPVIDTVDALRDLADETGRMIDADAANAEMTTGRLQQVFDKVGIEPQIRAELTARHGKEVRGLRDEARVAIARETAEMNETPRASLWETAKRWREDHGERIAVIKQKKEDGSITAEYGKGVVNSKEKMCADDRQACVDAYVERLREGGREAPSAEALHAALEAGLNAKAEKRVLTIGRENVLFQEMTQEIAYADFQRRKEGGEATLGAEGISADMLVELDLEEKEELEMASMQEAREAVHNELLEYIEKGYLTEKEAALIQVTVEKYGDVYVAAFEGKRFPGGEIMTRERLIQDAYEGMRDNARKIAFQTKLDKRVFSGSDHGTRHICEGCTHFSETMMDSMNGLEGVDFKPQDEVLIRQIIIDHDIGYTTDAAQAKGGFEASKDHPCAGCDFVESNKDYYVQKYGQEGYDTIRDVVLNHSYVQTEYQGTRQESAPDEITYNRDLIRSVVSTVDAMGVTYETKAMDMFRHPEAIDLLLNVKLYTQTHDGKMDEAALAEVKKDFNTLIDTWVANGSVSAQRASGYRSAVENQFNPVTVEITLGQFTGVVREMTLKKRSDGTIAPEIQMDISRMAALVGDSFGDKTALKGFAKAMEDFGLSESLLQEQAATVHALQAQTDPTRRAELQARLRFESDRATFQVGEHETTGLQDEREEEIQAITEHFEQFQRDTVRSEIQRSFYRIRETPSNERGPEMAVAVGNELRALFELDDEEAEKINLLTQRLFTHITNDAEVSKIQAEVNRFKSKTEKERLRKYETAAATEALKLAA